MNLCASETAQELLEVTPNPGDRNGPVATMPARARAALPYGLESRITKPKGGTAYPMPATGNNHAFAFMEPAWCSACLTGGTSGGDAEPAETALAQASTVPGPLYHLARPQDPKGGSATSVLARANHPMAVAHTTPPVKSITPAMKSAVSTRVSIQLLRMVRLNRWTASE